MNPNRATNALETLDTLYRQRAAWQSRPLVRQLYRGWFELVSHHLAKGPGPTVELGAGSGIFKEFMPGVVATDVLETPWADQVVDAERLPFDDNSITNLVMIDVLHHVPEPATALQEAQRTLRPGGRLVMLEPYCSPVAGWVYRRFHHENADLNADPAHPAPASSTDPFDANNALPTLIFFRRQELVAKWVPALEIVERQRLAWLVYPLSGGFSKPPLIPGLVAPAILALERALAPLLAPLFAFRCLVVLERR